MPEDAMLGRKGKVIAKFTINRDGKLADGSLGVVESSGRKDLDSAALSAIKSSAPFKGFPQGFAGPASIFDLPFFITSQ
jgi:TonB family protein